MKMKVGVAMEVIRNNISITEPQEVALNDAAGRTLARDLVADHPLSPFANSAVDGFAIASQDSAGAASHSPVELQLHGESRAGVPTKEKVTSGQAIRIMTGAVMPPGATAVVKQENVVREEGRIKLNREIESGANIREKGEDFKNGELILKAGSVLRASHMSVLAALGRTTVQVAPKPRVGLLATGDELLTPEEPLSPGKIRDINTTLLTAFCREHGAEAYSFGIVRDTRRQLREKLNEALSKKLDLLIITGGVSVGDYDLVRPILDELGFEEQISGVAIKPGKPVLFGKIAELPVFGLPGNPGAVFVSAELFLKEALVNLTGSKKLIAYTNAVCSENIKDRKGRRFFARAYLEEKKCRLSVKPLPRQSSALITPFVEANSLLEIPEDCDFVKKGEVVKVRLLN